MKLPIEVSIKKMKSIENSKYIVPVKCSNAVLYFSSFTFSENSKKLYFYGTIFGGNCEIVVSGRIPLQSINGYFANFLFKHSPAHSYIKTVYLSYFIT